MQALAAPSDPRQGPAASALFAGCPTYRFCKPAKWPGSEPDATTAQLLWDRENLYILYHVEGSFAPAISVDQCEPSVLDALLRDYTDPTQVVNASFADAGFQRTILLDDRCEVFVQPVLPGVPFQSYYALEINRDGRAITNINNSVVSRAFDRSWDASAAYTARFSESDQTLLVTLRWAEMGISPGQTEVNIGLFRAQKPAPLAAKTIGAIDMSIMSMVNAEMMWSAWRDPGDDVVDFHRSAFLGELKLLPPLPKHAKI